MYIYATTHLSYKRCNLTLSTTISSKKYDNFVVLELEYMYSFYTPTVLKSTYNNFVVLQLEYDYLLYTTISSKKYDNFVVLE